METKVRKKLFTVEEYHRLGTAGIFRPEDRVELIDGEIIEMSPIGRRHRVCVSRATTLFFEAFGRRAVLSPQNPVRLSDWTEPQPDIIVFKPRADFYAKKEPTPEDVLFLVEVSDSSLAYDRDIKAPRYADAAIHELWIADLRNDLVRVYRDPAGGNYKTVLTFRPGETVSPLPFPETSFRVDDLVSTDYEPSANER
jgi:Uma2 family endonuclease